MLDILKCELKKSICNIGFVFAFLITALLCFTSDGYTDSTNDKVYSVFEEIVTADKSVIYSDCNLASILIFRKALTGYITMFLPIITAFSFMVNFCSEQNSGYMRFTIVRTGKFRYYISKFLSAIISGGTAIATGVAVYGIIAAIYFPCISSYDVSEELLLIILPDGEFLTAVKVLLSAFVYGVISVLPAFLLSSFCKNPYIITCVPFLLVYIQNTFINRLVSESMVNADNDRISFLRIFYQNALPEVIYGNSFGKNELLTLVLNIVYIVIILTGFVFIMNKHTDKGA